MVMRYNKDGLEYIPTDKTIEKVLDKENSDEFDVGYYLGFQAGQKFFAEQLKPHVKKLTEINKGD